MKVLIVDDELPIREWLKMSVMNLERKLADVKTAGNGKDAWELFLKEKPDMVITDIKMPKMDGLELLRRIKESAPETYVAMLTSYSEFEYAREAIKHQANEYILKNEITSQVLEQMLQNFEESQNGQEELKKVPFIKDIISGVSNGQKLFEEKEEEQQIFAIALEERGKESYAFEAYLNSFVQKIKQYPYDETISIWICSYKNTYSAGACFSEVMSFCRNVASLKELSVGFSGFTEDLLLACKNARKALNFRFYENREGVFTYRDEDENSMLKIRNIRKKIVSMVTKERQEEAENYIGDLIKEIEKHQILDLDLVFGCFMDIVDAYKVSKLEYAGHELEELCKSTKGKIAKAENIKGMKEIMDAFLRELKGAMAVSERPYSNYVKSAMAYVADNYAHMDSLAEVAEYININSEYFCRVFKSEVGMTFNSYLTSYRIKRAMELLTKTDLKVYEVAERVGYPNLSYFSRVFKKVTGVNPFFYKN